VQHYITKDCFYITTPETHIYYWLTFANLWYSEGTHAFQKRQGINVIPYEIHKCIDLFHLNVIVKKIFTELLVLCVFLMLSKPNRQIQIKDVNDNFSNIPSSLEIKHGFANTSQWEKIGILHERVYIGNSPWNFHIRTVSKKFKKNICSCIAILVVISKIYVISEQIQISAS
jgi:hypothetical protein